MDRRRDRSGGQSLIEATVLIVAVVSALMMMSIYVRQAFNAFANGVENEMNGAVRDNKPKG